MSSFLLDVNILIALVRETHASHRLVQRWFRQIAGVFLGYLSADGS